MRRLFPLFILMLLLLFPTDGMAQGTYSGNIPSSGATSENIQNRGTTYIEIILDCSDTMKRQVDQTTKLGAAKSALLDFVNEAPDNYKFALRVMGGRAGAQYYTSDLVAGMGLLSKYSLIEKIKEQQPGGERSLYHALQECLYDFPDDAGNNIVLVITDGLDDGGQNLEDLQYYYENNPGAPRVYFYGIDINEDISAEFNAIAKSAGGRVYDIDNMQNLKDTLTKSINDFSGNLSVYVYDGDGTALNSEILVYDVSGEPVRAAYDTSALITELPAGIYTIKVKYMGETKDAGPFTIDSTSAGKVSVVFSPRAGNVRVTLLDSLLNPIKGMLEVTDVNRTVVYEGGPSEEFSVSLPEGTYDIEGSSGGRSYTESGVVVTYRSRDDIEIVIPISQSIIEVDLNTVESVPINGNIKVYASDGFLMGEAAYATYYHIQVPPDTYTVTAEVGDQRLEQTIYITEGDQRTVEFSFTIEIGYLIVELRTDNGRDAWGLVRIYDNHGRYQRHWTQEGEESPDWAFELPEGIYRVEAEVEGIISARDGVVIKGNEETRLKLMFPEEVG